MTAGGDGAVYGRAGKEGFQAGLPTAGSESEHGWPIFWDLPVPRMVGSSGSSLAARTPASSAAAQAPRGPAGARAHGQVSLFVAGSPACTAR